VHPAKILLLSPRRIAARAAAERMADMAGEPFGQTIGYATRLDSRRSPRTRILVMTEGIFRNRILADPELQGVSAVLFDEVHERSLDSDFGLALALDVQAALRPDLRLLAMSATLDGARFSALLDDAPVLESAGRSYKLTLRHVGRASEVRFEDAMAQAIRTALREEEGGVLAFLPGVAEIERVAERLTALPSDVVLHRLHGTLDPAAQRAAIARAPSGVRKLVLATAIAETSLTIDGVRVVVDGGLARRARYDRAAGVTRLVTERVSQAAATQRAGRAARQGPGTAWRLWEEAGTQGLPPFDPPEIVEADLSALVLDCALWGEADPARLRWLDPPPAPALAEARARLLTLEAIDGDGRPTAHGRAMAALPMPPRLGHMLLRARDKRLAAEVAVLLGERGLGGNEVDLDARLRRWRGERGARAEALRGVARRWAGLAGQSEPGTESVGACLALAFPDRVARRRDGDGADWISAGGRGFRLDPLSPLARETWLAVGDVQGSAAGARILSAAPLDQAEVEALFAERIVRQTSVRFDPATGGVSARWERRLGAIRLARGPDEGRDADAITSALVEGVRRHGLALLPWGEAAIALRQRVAFAAPFLGDLPGMDDSALIEALDEWLPALVAGRRRLDAIPPAALDQALRDRIGWEGLRRLDRIAPPSFQAPAGSGHPIDYGAEGGPGIEVRPQALFGLATHPMVGDGRVPLVLRLVSPAGRIIQTTRDLPGFWAGSWADVAREMRGRYPRHPWPDDPAAADATLRTKRADARARS
jgi:ATP-dependent helicase HrpB